jgi:hypothetical protein
MYEIPLTLLRGRGGMNKLDNFVVTNSINWNCRSFSWVMASFCRCRLILIFQRSVHTVPSLGHLNPDWYLAKTRTVCNTSGLEIQSLVQFGAVLYEMVTII